MAKATRYTPEMIEEYTRKGFWQEITFSQIWDRNALLYPEKMALVDSNNRLTWGQARLWIDRVALGFLKLGLKKGDLIVIQLPNCVEGIMLRMACEKTGILCLPILHSFRQKEVEEIIDRMQPVAMVVQRIFRGFDHFEMASGLREKRPWLKHIFVTGEDVPEGGISLKAMAAEPMEKTSPPNLLERDRCKATEFSLILATSGTTGFPKFIEYPICSTMCRERSRNEDFKLTGEDIYGGIGPALGGPNGPIYYGFILVAARVVLLDKFDPEKAMELIEKERITFLPAVPAQLNMMLKHPSFGKYDLSSLRCIWSSGATMPYDLGMEVERKMGRITQAYSAIDSSVGCEHTFDMSLEERVATVGRPYAGAEVILVDDDGRPAAKGEVGEVVVRGPGGVGGFYGDPESTWQAWSKDGWFHMGDLGKFDDRGNLTIVGRKKDVIIRGGQNIFPAEIEDLLTTHPKVSQAAVVRMPDALKGEKACAYLVMKNNESLTFEEMILFLKSKNLATFKLPERLETVDTLPTVAAGQKVDKKVLEKDILARMASHQT
ncbi:MAG: AMP-binding protein [Dehalococcoidia bacterium]|nr:AMP-binding protein [Dehalococcoidia bacterium]